MKRYVMLCSVVVLAVILSGCCTVCKEETATTACASACAGSCPNEAGFVKLFNGKDLTGWQGDLVGYVPKDGVITTTKECGKLLTEKAYNDFILRFEFQLTPGANNGLAIRSPKDGGAFNGMELQILDNTAEKYAELKEWQYHASVYGIAPAKRGFQRPVGEWNEQEVIAKGSHITVNLNGAKILDVCLKEAIANGTLDGKEHVGVLNPGGFIGFLGHGDILSFRNIRIKEL